MTRAIVLKNIFVKEKFSFVTDKNDIEAPDASPSPENEYKAVREGIAAADLSTAKIYEISGDEAVDYLDFVLTGPVGRLREEHILHTLCIDNEADIISDIYALNIDSEKYFLLTDGGDHNDFDEFLRNKIDDFDVHVKDVSSIYGLFSIDGPYSMLFLKNIFGPEILGLRYMAFFPFIENGVTFYVCRAGKTGEYGFWIMTLREKSPVLFAEIWKSARETTYPVSLYGEKIRELVRLENNFLNIDTVGKFTRNPFELGLFWAVQLDKEMAAKKTLEKIVENKITQSVIGFRVDNGIVQEGDFIFYKGQEIGQVIAARHSFAMDKQIGQALMKVEYGYTGLSYFAGPESATIQTVNMPFIYNKSLTVKVS